MNKTNTTNQNETVVGVFLDERYAQRAIQQLKSAGYNARIADKSAIDSFSSLGWKDEVVLLYQSRFGEGNSIVVVEGANGSGALSTLLDNGAEYINLKGAGDTMYSTQNQQSNAKANQTQYYDANYYRNLNTQKRQYGAYDQNLGRARNAEEIKLQLRDETLTPVKEARQAGEVQLKKVVHEEQVDVPVTLRREEVVIERTPVNRAVSGTDTGITMDDDQTIRVPVYEETVELQKQTRVREEVALGKKTVEEQRTMHGTERHEEAKLEQTGNARVSGNAENVTTRDNRTNYTTQNQDQSMQDDAQA